jgi:hypothetical protein
MSAYRRGVYAIELPVLAGQRPSAVWIGRRSLRDPKLPSTTVSYGVRQLRTSICRSKALPARVVCKTGRRDTYLLPDTARNPR